MTKRNDSSYLWDGSGPPDPHVARLEALLAQLRQPAVLPSLPRQERPARRLSRRVRVAMATAAAALMVATLAWLTSDRPRAQWSVQTIAGNPIVDASEANQARTAADRLAVGEWLVTDAVSRARISVAQIGRVDVEPNTRLQLTDVRGREHHLALARGGIHARIWAPPRLFLVNTPSATAIDLGCEYTLQVDDNGVGVIRVSSGWVAFESGARQAYIPAGARGTTRPGIGPGTPYYEDAPSGFGEALDVLDVEQKDSSRRAAALERILQSARSRDTLTLWHLLQRGTSSERARVYDRLASLVPPPQTVTRSAVLSGDRRALEQWWDLLGVDNTTWWKLGKKRP
jgi:hypothetical protein